MPEPRLASTDYPTAESFLKKAIPTFEGELGRERFGLAGYPAVMSRWVLASSLAERGQFDEALRYAEEGWRTAEEVRHPYSLDSRELGLALVHVLKGEFSLGQPARAGLALCRDWSVPVLSPITAGSRLRAAAFGKSRRRPRSAAEGYEGSGVHGRALPFAPRAVAERRLDASPPTGRGA